MCDHVQIPITQDFCLGFTTLYFVSNQQNILTLMDLDTTLFLHSPIVSFSFIYCIALKLEPDKKFIFTKLFSDLVLAKSIAVSKTPRQALLFDRLLYWPHIAWDHYETKSTISGP